MRYVQQWIRDNWLNSIFLIIIGIVYVCVDEFYVTLLVGGVIIVGTAMLSGIHKKRDIGRYVGILVLWTIYQFILY